MTTAATDLDPFAGGGEKRPAVSFKDKPVGTVITMLVVDSPKLVQSRDYETGEPATWPDGNPKMSVVTEVLVDGEEMSLWAAKPSSLFAALAEAQRSAGARIATGGTLAVKFTGEKPNSKNPRLNPQKLYAAKYTAPDPFGGASEPAAAPAAAPVQTDEPPF